MPQAIHLRKYAAGDRVMVLGVRRNNTSVPLQNARPGPTEQPCLIEGVVRDKYQDDGTWYLTIQYNVEAERRVDGHHEIASCEYVLSQQGFNHLYARLYDAARYLQGMRNLTREKLVFIKQFLFPAVVASGGYVSLLTDFAKVMDRPIDNIALADSAAITAEAARYGVAVQPYMSDTVPAVFREIQDIVTNQFETLEDRLFPEPVIAQVDPNAAPQEQAAQAVRVIQNGVGMNYDDLLPLGGWAPPADPIAPRPNRR